VELHEVRAAPDARARKRRHRQLLFDWRPWYLPGRRSENWLKIKTRMQQEAVIGGITEPSGGRHYFGALMLGVYDKGRLQ